MSDLLPYCLRCRFLRASWCPDARMVTVAGRRHRHAYGHRTLCGMRVTR